MLSNKLNLVLFQVFFFVCHIAVAETFAITEFKYEGHQSKSGSSWRSRVGSIVPLTKACGSSGIAHVLTSATNEAISKCLKDGAFDCKIQEDLTTVGNKDLGCYADVVVFGKKNTPVIEAPKKTAAEVEFERQQAELKYKQTADALDTRLSESRTKLFEQGVSLAQQPISDLSQLDSLISASTSSSLLIEFTMPSSQCMVCSLNTLNLSQLISEKSEFKYIPVQILSPIELKERFDISVVPTILILKDAKILKKIEGVKTQKQLEEFLRD